VDGSPATMAEVVMVSMDERRARRWLFLSSFVLDDEASNADDEEREQTTLDGVRVAEKAETWLEERASATQREKIRDLVTVILIVCGCG
jgi:hypothetical protein